MQNNILMYLLYALFITGWAWQIQLGTSDGLKRSKLLICETHGIRNILASTLHTNCEKYNFQKHCKYDIQIHVFNLQIISDFI